MKKWVASVALVLMAATSFAFGYADWQDSAPSPAGTAALDPLATSEAHRHLNAQPTHWVSMVLVME
jgi:hypothetical protein